MREMKMMSFYKKRREYISPAAEAILLIAGEELASSWDYNSHPDKEDSWRWSVGGWGAYSHDPVSGGTGFLSPDDWTAPST